MEKPGGLKVWERQAGKRGKERDEKEGKDNEQGYKSKGKETRTRKKGGGERGKGEKP